MNRVNKYTRAGGEGKHIYCSNCNVKTKVYHFSWSALQCGGCKNMIDKYDYLLEARRFRSRQGRSNRQYKSSFMVLILSFILLLISFIIFL
tara:strand:+ start:994 stop:1266 length:273 start_codon:yes stop_codon:yes gene_type:complete